MSDTNVTLCTPYPVVGNGRLLGVGAGLRGNSSVQVIYPQASSELISIESQGCITTVSINPALCAEPIAMIAQGTSYIIANGATLTLNALASGGGPFTYQWYFNNVAITGAVSAIYSIVSAGSSNSGNYTVAVTNNCGTSTSVPTAVAIANPATNNGTLSIKTVVNGSGGPADGASTYQNNLMIGALYIDFCIVGGLVELDFGGNAMFSFNSSTGTITRNIPYVAGDGVYIQVRLIA